MTQDQIFELAKKAGFMQRLGVICIPNVLTLERFAALVADAEAKRIYEEGMVTVGHMREQIEKERERAALLTEHLGMIGYGTLAIAAAIRRGDQESTTTLRNEEAG